MENKFHMKDFKQVENPEWPYGDKDGYFELKFMDGLIKKFQFIEAIEDKESEELNLLYKDESGEYYNCFAQCEDDLITQDRITMYSVDEWEIVEFKALKDGE